MEFAEHIEQGTDQWKTARAGLVTASRICDVVAKIKSGEASARADYRAQLVAEILTGAPQDDSYQSKEMAYGIEMEPIARGAYEIIKGVFVEQVGLILHPSIPRAAASPDGLVGDDGLVEIKCPKVKTHINYILNGDVPRNYLLQMQWQMACTGRRWCDWVSYRHELPEDIRFHCIRVKRDEKLISQLEDEVKSFISEIDETIKRLRSR